MDATKDVECHLQSYEIAMRALVCDLKEQRSPLDIDDPNYKVSDHFRPSFPCGATP